MFTQCSDPRRVGPTSQMCAEWAWTPDPKPGETVCTPFTRRSAGKTDQHPERVGTSGWESGREGQEGRSLGTRTRGGHLGVFTGRILQVEPTAQSPPPPRAQPGAVRQPPAPGTGPSAAPRTDASPGGGGPAGRHRLPGGTRCQPLLAPQGTTVPPGLLQGPGCPPGKTPSSPLPCPPLLRPPARGESLCDPE